ncbi:hypothetical protein [Schlesneria sp. T3-172]|uniref:hypothetical protein n=1 Tax=Schlesneria sphaerica TaxID=3373610 RepID=UPI0037C70987
MVARFAIPLVLSRRRLSIPKPVITPGSGIVDIIRVTGQALKWLRPGDTCYGEFQIRNPTTGVLTSPDNIDEPAIEVLRNNVVDIGIEVVVSAASTGRYRYHFTVPGDYLAGDFVAGVASATVDEHLDIATLVDTRLVGVDWTNPGGGSGGTILNNITIPAAVAQASLVAAQITIIRGDTLAVVLPLMGDISTRTKLVFTAKVRSSDPDIKAIIQVSEAEGLVLLNGSSDVNPAHASLEVTGASTGQVQLVIDGAETAELAIRDLIWDCQFITAARISTPISGGISIVPDVTQATA